jgi:hypothetical protein
MNKDIMTLVVSITILLAGIIAGVTVYHLNDRMNFAKNMESAIAKGVDPLSVKCSYEERPTSTCIAYALGKR